MFLLTAWGRAISLHPQPGQTLVMADLEHLTAELFRHVQRRTPFDLLVPMKNTRLPQSQLDAIPDDQFTRRGAGFATLKQPYHMAQRDAGDLFQCVPRTGEKSDDCHRNAERLRKHYEQLPDRLEREHISPRTAEYFDEDDDL